MLPALCYVFSRKQLEKCAEELTTNLLEFDSKIPYTVDRECEQIIRKLPNYAEYLHLPEYVNTVKLLRKGVGIHHAGLMPILREMTELLFARGFIKILFCTETMSVGINLPVKTTIFTDVNKFNGEITRTLYSHEYTQAAGRAGRLGLDVVGHVIHLNNLFRDVDSVSYKTMMNGKPQILTSKFKFSYNLLLNLIDIGDNNIVNFASRSMIRGDLENQSKRIQEQITNLNGELENMKLYAANLRTPKDIIGEYNKLQINRNVSVNKKRKELERMIQQIQENYKFIEID
jgi:antiviral helicase SKI2